MPRASRAARIAGLHACSEVIDRETVLELEPALARHATGGIWVERDGYALPYRTTTAFRLAAHSALARVFSKAPPCAASNNAARAGLAHTPRGTFSAEKLVAHRRARGPANWPSRWRARPVHPEGLMLMVTHRVALLPRNARRQPAGPLSFKQFDNGTVVIGGKLIGNVPTWRIVTAKSISCGSCAAPEP